MGYGRFVLVSFPRSGTHLLRSCLESHPAIACQAEPFNPDDRRLPYPLSTPTREVLDGWVFHPRHPPEIEQVGFVLQAYHPWSLRTFPGARQNPAWADVWEILRAMDGLRVIHLERRNLLRRHLSFVTSRATGKWHQWDRSRVAGVSHLAPPPPGEIGPRRGEAPAVPLEAERLRSDFEEVEHWRRAAREALAGRPCHVVVYEDLCREPDTVCRGVQEFLGVAPRILVPAVSKLDTRPLPKAIPNLDALAHAFRGTRWQPFFEE